MLDSKLSIAPKPTIFAPETEGKFNKKAGARSISNVFRVLVIDYEQSHPHDISIMKIAKDNSIQHRRVYDFFNLLSYLNVCQIVERGKLSWVGTQEIAGVVREVYTQIECMSVSQGIKELFNVGQSPSLGILATKFISLYFYLGMDKLLLRQVSILFHDGKSDIKSLERRMYLVLNFLEIIGVVIHTTKTGEYRLLIYDQQIKDQAMQQRFWMAQSASNNFVESMMSHCSQSYENSIARARQAEFSQLVL